MTDDEILTVVQAHKEGKQIQGKCRRLSNIWVDVVGELTWDFVDKEYRVKPEPRKELWLQECSDGLWQEKWTGLGRHFIETEASHLGKWGSYMVDHSKKEVLPRKPREWVVVLEEDGSISSNIHPVGPYKLFRVREVIGE